MKKAIIFIIMICSMMFIYPTSAPAKSNWSIVKTLCKSYHKPIKIIRGGNTKKNIKIVSHRKGKNYIVVEQVVSYSYGNYGFDKDGYYIAYNKKVRKGKQVTSYIIYDCNSNEPDEILYVVDNNQYR